MKASILRVSINIFHLPAGEIWLLRVVSCLLLNLLILSLLIFAAPAYAEGPFPLNGTIEVFFTPQDKAQGALLAAIAGSQQTIHVQAYIFTSRHIAKALLEAHQRGVRVEVIVDAYEALKESKRSLNFLFENGIKIHLAQTAGIAHSKVMLIDIESIHPIVITGSYNFSYAAQEKNTENLLLIRDNPIVARAYFANWHSEFAKSLPYQP